MSSPPSCSTTWRSSLPRARRFPFKGQDDLIGKKGVTNQGESYGTEFDAFIKDKLDVARADGIDDAFKDLLSGKADYLIAGYYPGLAEAAKAGVKDEVEVLDQALLTAEMFVAFSKKSPCTALAEKFGQAITEMTTDGSFDTMLTMRPKRGTPRRPRTDAAPRLRMTVIPGLCERDCATRNAAGSARTCRQRLSYGARRA